MLRTLGFEKSALGFGAIQSLGKAVMTAGKSVGATTHRNIGTLGRKLTPVDAKMKKMVPAGWRNVGAFSSREYATGYGAAAAGLGALGLGAAGVRGLSKKAFFGSTALKAIDKSVQTLGTKILPKTRAKALGDVAMKRMHQASVKNIDPGQVYRTASKVTLGNTKHNRIFGYGTLGAGAVVGRGIGAGIGKKAKLGKYTTKVKALGREVGKKLKKGYKSTEETIGELATDKKYSDARLAVGVAAVGSGSGVTAGAVTAKNKAKGMKKKASKVGGIKGTTGLNDKKLINVAQDALKELGRPVHTDDHVDVSSPATHDPTYLGYFVKDKANTDKKIVFEKWALSPKTVERAYNERLTRWTERLLNPMDYARRLMHMRKDPDLYGAFSQMDSHLHKANTMQKRLKLYKRYGL